MYSLYSVRIRTRSIAPLGFMLPSGELRREIWKQCETTNSQDEVKRQVYLEVFKRSVSLWGPIRASELLYQLLELDLETPGWLFEGLWRNSFHSPSIFLEKMRKLARLIYPIKYGDH